MGGRGGRVVRNMYKGPMDKENGGGRTECGAVGRAGEKGGQL